MSEPAQDRTSAEDEPAGPDAPSDGPRQPGEDQSDQFGEWGSDAPFDLGYQSAFELERPPFNALIIRERGELRTYSGSLYGETLQAVSGERGDAFRAKASTHEEIVTCLRVPDEHQRVFCDALTRCFPRKVPAQIKRELLRELSRARGWRGESGTDGRLARELPARADEALAFKLKQKHQRSCGCATLELVQRRTDGSRDGIRRLLRLRCRSHRERHCAKSIAQQWRQRLRAQFDRDEEAGLGDAWALITLTVDRKEFVNETEALRALDRLVRAFVKVLRSLFGSSVREAFIDPATGDVALNRRTGEARWRTKEVSDVAYFAAVESHKSGWPHVHLLVRSRRMVEAILKEAGVPTVKELHELQASLEKQARPGRHPIAFPKLRRKLNQAAVDAGLGRSGFYVCPVRTPTDVVGYVTKWEGDPSARRSRVAAEMAKDVQNPGAGGALPFHARRFRASGKAGDWRLSSFFYDEAPGAWDELQGKVPPEAHLPLESTVIYKAPITAVSGHYNNRGARPDRGELHRIDRRDSTLTDDVAIAGDGRDSRIVLDGVTHDLDGLAALCDAGFRLSEFAPELWERDRFGRVKAVSPSRRGDDCPEGVFDDPEGRPQGYSPWLWNDRDTTEDDSLTCSIPDCPQCAYPWAFTSQQVA